VQHGIPIFLDQLIKTLSAEQATDDYMSVRVSGASGGKVPERSEIGASAARHGRELSSMGFSFDQVVRAYGDICQAITELATEDAAPVHVVEFKTLNRCLDNAIADAVTEFAFQQRSIAADKELQKLDARLAVFMVEMSKQLQSATLAIAAIKAGNVGLNGVTGHILDLSLVAMHKLMEQPLAAAKAGLHLPERHQLIPLASFIDEVKTFSAPEARARRCRFTAPEVDPGLEVDADRDMLFSVVGSLLENAFQFTQPRSEVVLSAYSAGDHILIDVEDNCGGLTPEVLEGMFASKENEHSEGKAFRYSLPACRRGIEQNGGTLTVRTMPGIGCVFTITLPRTHPRQPETSGAN